MSAPHFDNAKDVLAPFRGNALPHPKAQRHRFESGRSCNLWGYCADQGILVAEVLYYPIAYEGAEDVIQRDFVLVGHDSRGQPWRHPVSGAPIRQAVRRHPDDPRAAIRAAQRWMWRASSRQLAAGIRHRDILLVPGRRLPAGKPIGDPFIPIHGGLTISAGAMIRTPTGVVWADSPTVYRNASSHSYRGWHSIRSAREQTDVWRAGMRLPPGPLPILT